MARLYCCNYDLIVYYGIILYCYFIAAKRTENGFYIPMFVSANILFHGINIYILIQKRRLAFVTSCAIKVLFVVNYYHIRSICNKCKKSTELLPFYLLFALINTIAHNIIRASKAKPPIIHPTTSNQNLKLKYCSIRFYS